MRHSRGFSLLELVVSLAILAALATVAMRSANNLQSQTRYQVTTSSLNEIRSAIVSPPNQRNPDGTPLVTGFVADTGRLPQAVVDGADPYPLGTPARPGDPFSELLRPSTIAPFSFVASNTDPTIKIGVGWQGPYMRLGAGPSYLRDGWGNSFQYTPNLFGTASTIASGGSGGADTYGQPVTVTLPGSGLGSPFASFSGSVRMLDASGNPTLPNATSSATAVTIWVCYFGPDLTAAPNKVVTFPFKITDTINFTYVLSDQKITIGSRVLKAYVLPATEVTFDYTKRLYESAPLNVIGVGGGQQVSNLVLPNYAP